jgi:hypothetical protein
MHAPNEVLTSPANSAPLARGTVLVCVLVWVAAVGSAAALTFDLNRPLVFPHDVDNVVDKEADEEAPPPIGSSPAVLALESAAITMPIPEINVATRAGRQTAVRLTAPREPRDIGQMHCSDWREMQAGSGRVQICD